MANGIQIERNRWWVRQMSGIYVYIYILYIVVCSWLFQLLHSTWVHRERCVEDIQCICGTHTQKLGYIALHQPHQRAHFHAVQHQHNPIWALNTFGGYMAQTDYNAIRHCHHECLHTKIMAKRGRFSVHRFRSFAKHLKYREPNMCIEQTTFNCISR